jgi:hypothetical protein
MGLRKFQLIAICVWLTVLAIGVGVSMVLGVRPSPAGQLLLVLAAVVPATLCVILFRGAPPRSVTQILYDQEHPGRPVVSERKTP